jgi:hypothetical protein
MGTGIAVSGTKSRKGVAWTDNTISSRDKGVRPQGLRLFYLTLRDVRGKA